MFQTPEFWVLVAFVLLIVVLGKRGWLALSAIIDERTDKIQKQLQEAEHLHNEALSLLHTYQKKHAEAMSQAASIIANAEEEAANLKRTVEAELEEMLRQKEKSTLERIEIAQDTAKLQLKKQVAAEALSFVEEILSQELKGKSAAKSHPLQEISAIPLTRQ